MSPELTFLLTLGLRMAITAGFVVSASVITERSGPALGALVATLPISAGPSYVFLALDHDAAFIAQGALASLPINAATIFLGLTYVVLAQRRSALVSCSAAVAVWIALALTARTVHWSLAGGLLVNAIAFAICVPLLQRFRHVKMPLVTRRWYDIPLRAALVATLVACAGVTLKSVATAIEVPLKTGNVIAEGDLDFRGTLGVDKEAPVGFAEIRLRFEVETDAPQERLDLLSKLTERYCVVYQTIKSGPKVSVSMKRV